MFVQATLLQLNDKDSWYAEAPRSLHDCRSRGGSKSRRENEVGFELEAELEPFRLALRTTSNQPGTLSVLGADSTDQQVHDQQHCNYTLSDTRTKKKKPSSLSHQAAGSPWGDETGHWHT